MPTYDYRCDDCEHSFEEFQPITARPLRKCPKCGRPKLRRLIGAGGGVIFKGSGFYQTDYRSDSYKKAAEAETKPAQTGSKSSTTESKPAPAKAETGKSDPAKSEKKGTKARRHEGTK